MQRHTVCVSTDQQFLHTFGRRLGDIRRKKGVTQERLAELVEVHRTYIGFIEQGKRNPTIANINRIAKALGISLKDLFGPFN